MKYEDMNINAVQGRAWNNSYLMKPCQHFPESTGEIHRKTQCVQDNFLMALLQKPEWGIPEHTYITVVHFMYPYIITAG
jgi:hypothetical protein